MIHEKSCGVVLYYMTKSSSAEILLLHYPEGHWGFPKGHTEKGEDDLQTALRELKEETGIGYVELVDAFKEKMHYLFKNKGETISKDVYFFLAKTSNKNIELSYEHQNFDWLPYDEALKRLTFDNAKEILKKTKQFLA
ncbi:NUDIX domain-containing protein [bacterium]|nr:NUDIX domain-containing protein [bacterium]